MKSKVVKLFLMLGVITLSIIFVGCKKMNFFVEIYDGEIISGEGSIEKFFEITNDYKKKATIEIKKTSLLDKDKCSEEYYKEHIDEYPKVSITKVSYDGNQYIYSYNNQETRPYRYLKREKMFGYIENIKESYDFEYYLVNDYDLTLSAFISAALDSTMFGLNFYALAPIMSTEDVYKQLVFDNSDILRFAIKEKNLDERLISSDDNYLLLRAPYRMLRFVDSLEWKPYDKEAEETLSPSDKYYISISTKRELIDGEEKIKSFLKSGINYLTYVFDLESNVVYAKDADDVIILYADFAFDELADTLNKINIYIIVDNNEEKNV